MLPAMTLAAALLVMATSAAAVTLVITGGVVLLVGLGSPVGLFTLATLVSVPLAGALTVTVKLLAWPLANAPKFQLTTPALLLPLPLALTKVTPAGRLSVTDNDVAVEGPRFVTVMV